MFKRNKKNLIEKYEQKSPVKVDTSKEDKPKRTKEDILKKRKEIMKYERPTSKVKFTEMNTEETETSKRFERTTISESNISKTGKEPSSMILERLAMGVKPKVINIKII